MRSRTITALLSMLLVVTVAAGCKTSSTATGTGAGTGVSATAGTLPAATATAGTAPGSASTVACPSSNTTSFAKTKFVVHSGLAFGAFHRYLYKPFRAGTFGSGAHGRLAAFIKAGLAALFIKREVRLAYDDVQANPTLCAAIAQPLRVVGDDIQTAVDKIKGGDTSAVTAVESTVASVETKAASAGTAIQEDANAPLA